MQPLPLRLLSKPQRSGCTVFQQCSDIGALIFVVPTVDTVQQAQEAAKWVRYPPVARRSTGGGQHGRVWGNDYANTYNDNCILICMVETAVGIANAHDIARVPGVDVVITGNCKRNAFSIRRAIRLADPISVAVADDLQRFTGLQAGDPLYDKMLQDACDGVKRAGKIFGTTMPTQAEGETFSADAQFFYTGPSNDGWSREDMKSAYGS